MNCEVGFTSVYSSRFSYHFIFYIFKMSFQDSVNLRCKLVQVDVNAWELMWVHELFGSKVIINYHMLVINGHATKCLFTLSSGSIVNI
jgi:hypothetical protein